MDGVVQLASWSGVQTKGVGQMKLMAHAEEAEMSSTRIGPTEFSDTHGSHTKLTIVEREIVGSVGHGEPPISCMLIASSVAVKVAFAAPNDRTGDGAVRQIPAFETEPQVVPADVQT